MEQTKSVRWEGGLAILVDFLAGWEIDGEDVEEENMVREGGGEVEGAEIEESGSIHVVEGGLGGIEIGVVWGRKNWLV